jgi:predicted dehydrogenase
MRAAQGVCEPNPLPQPLVNLVSRNHPASLNVPHALSRAEPVSVSFHREQKARNPAESRPKLLADRALAHKGNSKSPFTPLDRPLTLHPTMPVSSLSRRSAARISVTALLTLPFRRSGAGETPPLRIGQIGTRHAHAAGKMASIRSLPHLWEMVGLVEPDPAQRSGSFAGLPVLTEPQLLGDPTVKAVAVETTLADSCATAARCVKAGKHVHLDKPGAIHHAEFKAMRLDAEARHLTVQMGYMLRYNPAFELLFRAVREGWLGEITEIDAAIGKLASPDLRKTLAELPGGGMFELACHVIDAVVTILGKPLNVTGFSTPTGGDGVPDNQLAVLGYGKATATIRCNHADPFGMPRRRFSVAGTLGAMEIVPLESGLATLSLTTPRENLAKGAQKLQLNVSKDRYAGEFVDLAAVIKGEKTLAWDAAHDIVVHETVLRASGLFKDGV